MGIKKGEEIGIKKGKIEIAKILKNKGLAMDDIKEVTGLTYSDIAEL